MWIVWGAIMVVVIIVLTTLFSAADDFNESENQDE